MQIFDMLVQKSFRNQMPHYAKMYYIAYTI